MAVPLAPFTCSARGCNTEPTAEILSDDPAHAQLGIEGPSEQQPQLPAWVGSACGSPTYRSCWLGARGCGGAWLSLPRWLASGRGRAPGSWLALLLQPSLRRGLLGGLHPKTLLLLWLLLRLWLARDGGRGGLPRWGRL